MIQKIKITQVTHYSKDKNNQAYKTKTGKPFVKININAEGFDKSLSALAFSKEDEIYSWKDGDEVLALVEVNGNYLNVRKATRLDVLEDKVNQLEKRIGLIGINKPANNDIPATEKQAVELDENPFGEVESRGGESDLPF